MAPECASANARGRNPLRDRRPAKPLEPLRECRMRTGVGVRLPAIGQDVAALMAKLIGELRPGLVG